MLEGRLLFDSTPLDCDGDGRFACSFVKKTGSTLAGSRISLCYGAVLLIMPILQPHDGVNFRNSQQYV